MTLYRLMQRLRRILRPSEDAAFRKALRDLAGL
jgi:hypothetical protein